MDETSRIKTLAESLVKGANELAGMAMSFAPPPKDIEPLLMELVAAEDAVDTHSRKWDGVAYKDSEEQRAEWGPICWRKRNAEQALMKYARAFVACAIEASDDADAQASDVAAE